MLSIVALALGAVILIAIGTVGAKSIRWITQGRTLAGILGFVGSAVLLAPFILGAGFLLMRQHPRSHDRARLTRCMSNLSQTGKACALYAMDHDGSCPASPADLTTIVGNNPKMFACGMSAGRAGEMTNVNDWTDYAFVSGLRSSDPPSAVLCYCSSPSHDGSTRPVLRLDGSVSTMNEKSFCAMTSNPTLFFGTTDVKLLTNLQSRTRILSRIGR